MTELTVLNGAAIQSLLTIPMAVRAVEQAYLEKSTGGAALWPMVFHEFTPGAADLDIKSGHMNGLGLYGMKVSWFGDNPAKDLPALYGTSLLFDIHTGAPRALLNAGPITDFRTGAAGAVGAKYLARPDAETLLMAGTGALAPYLIAAALYCLPQLKTVYVANPHHPERSAAACAAIVPQVEKLVAARGGAPAEGDGGRIELDLLRVDLAAVVGEHAHARGGNDQQAVAEEGEAVRAVVVVIIGVLARGVGLIVAQRAAEAVEIRQVQIRRGEHRSQHDREHRHQHQNTVERAAARRGGAGRAQILARELILVSH